MKILFALVIGLSSAFAHADCSKAKSAKVSPACRKELLSLMQNSAVSIAMGKALEKAYPLRSCQMVPASDLEIKFEKDEAVGPRLEVTADVTCESDSEAEGYQLSGEYFIEGGGYRFQKISLSTFE